MSSKPIFIHSLFRSGSTYFYSLFENSKTSDYFPFQEPLHEASFIFQEDADTLKSLAHAPDHYELLRHPSLRNGYFFTLSSVHKAWKGLASEDISYNQAFDIDNSSGLIQYLDALISAAPRRPVLQLVRTIWRVESIRSNFDGVYIHLWRNPRDQWWSYKATTYFEGVNLILAGTEKAPMFLRDLLQSFHIEPPRMSTFEARLEDVRLNPQTPENNYRLFLGLWLLAQHIARPNSDIDVSVDRLSHDAKYSRDKADEFKHAGISGIEFSGCDIPMAVFSRKEQHWFAEREQEVFDLFVEHYGEVAQPTLARAKGAIEFSSQKRAKRATAPSSDAQKVREALVERERLAVEQFEAGRSGKQLERNIESSLNDMVKKVEEIHHRSQDQRIAELRHQFDQQIEQHHAERQRLLSEITEVRSKTEADLSAHRDIIRKLETDVQKANEKTTYVSAKFAEESQIQRIAFEEERSLLIKQNKARLEAVQAEFDKEKTALKAAAEEEERQKEALSKELIDLGDELETRMKAEELLSIAQESHKKIITTMQRASAMERDALRSKHKNKMDKLVFELNSNHQNEISDLLSKNESIVNSLKSEISETRSENVQLVASHRNELGDFERKFAAVNQINEELNKRVSMLETLLADAENNYQQSLGVISEFRHSTSWAVTSPLRGLRRFFTSPIKGAVRSLASLGLGVVRVIPGMRWLIWKLVTPIKPLERKLRHFAQVRPRPSGDITSETLVSSSGDTQKRASPTFVLSDFDRSNMLRIINATQRNERPN